MGKKNSNFRLSRYSICIFISFLVLISIFSFNVSSDSNQLYIECLDQIEENQEFTIFVYANISIDLPELQSNVTIQFNGIIYELEDNLDFALKAPNVESNTNLSITASKDGFSSATKKITVLNSDDDVSNDLQLIIEPNSWLVNPDEQFYVNVYDQNNEPLEGATVFVQNYGNIKTTNIQGYAVLTAPKDGEGVTVKAKKQGYETGSIELTLASEKPIWEQIINHKFFTLFVAFIVLLISVIFVHLRQRYSIYARAKQISDKKVVEKYSPSNESISNAKKYGYDNNSSSNERIHIRPSSNSKVEEIRITRPQKQRRVIPVKTKKEQSKKRFSESSDEKDDYDSWFEGTDEVRYEIDKLTGEVDEEGMDKWFEGVDSLKEKVNEKMKKKKKKKDNDKY